MASLCKNPRILFVKPGQDRRNNDGPLVRQSPFSLDTIPAEENLERATYFSRVHLDPETSTIMVSYSRPVFSVLSARRCGTKLSKPPTDRSSQQPFGWEVVSGSPSRLT